RLDRGERDAEDDPLVPAEAEELEIGTARRDRCKDDDRIEHEVQEKVRGRGPAPSAPSTPCPSHRATSPTRPGHERTFRRGAPRSASSWSYSIASSPANERAGRAGAGRATGFSTRPRTPTTGFGAAVAAGAAGLAAAAGAAAAGAAGAAAASCPFEAGV